MNRKIVKNLQQNIKHFFDCEVPLEVLKPLADCIDRQIMERYFGGTWQSSYHKFGWTGWPIAERVNSLKPKRVLDVGCGFNELKERIPNLWGIDPYNDAADEKVGIMEFQSDELWDVILCLGSINFGTEVEEQITKVVSLLTPGGSIFFRFNPGKMHTHPDSRWIDFYDWNEETIRALAEKNGCTVVMIEPDGHRLYSHWIKP